MNEQFDNLNEQETISLAAHATRNRPQKNKLLGNTKGYYKQLANQNELLSRALQIIVKNLSEKLKEHGYSEEDLIKIGEGLDKVKEEETPNA